MSGVDAFLAFFCTFDFAPRANEGIICTEDSWPACPAGRIPSVRMRPRGVEVRADVWSSGSRRAWHGMDRLSGNALERALALVATTDVLRRISTSLIWVVATIFFLYIVAEQVLNSAVCSANL